MISTATLRVNEYNLKNIAAKNQTYPLSYFNMVSITKRIILDNTIKERTIYLRENSSILQAQLNPKSHDWRIIKIRNNIHERKWKIETSDANYYKQAKEMIEWTKRIQPISPQSLKWPNNMDYVDLNELRKKIEEETYQYYQSCHNMITKTICNSPNIWQSNNPV